MEYCFADMRRPLASTYGPSDAVPLLTVPVVHSAVLVLQDVSYTLISQFIVSGSAQH